MYKVNPTSYSSVFAIPTQIADEHLRMAGKAQLKVLLWLYRNPSATPDFAAISKDTGIPADEIDDAMYYWLKAGLVIDDSQNVPVSAANKKSATETAREEKQQKAAPVREDSEPKEKVKPVIVKPSHQDISMRIGESEELRSMYAEVQEVFGRTLGYDALSSLLIMHDHYSLPASVIIMLCNYAKTIGKQGSLSYIMKVAADWSEEGITDFESASRKIERMENAYSAWSEFKRLTGAENPKPTQSQADYLEIWINDFSFSMDVIYSAYERTVEKKGKISWGYMNGILKSWKESGHKTVDDVEKAEREYIMGAAAKKQGKKQNQASAPSYDIKLAMEKSKKLDPNKTKKGQ